MIYNAIIDAVIVLVIATCEEIIEEKKDLHVFPMPFLEILEGD